MIKKKLGILKRQLFNFIKHRKNKLVFYHYPANKEAINLNFENDISLLSIGTFAEYEAACKKYLFPMNTFYKSRFESNAVYKVLINEVDYISFGWAISNMVGFPIDEINIAINVPLNTFILFDFYTNPKYRNRKYYQLLLNYFVRQFKSHELIIYTLNNNYSSEKAIINSGFERVSESKYNCIEFIKILNERDINIDLSKTKRRL